MADLLKNIRLVFPGNISGIAEICSGTESVKAYPVSGKAVSVELPADWQALLFQIFFPMIIRILPVNWSIPVCRTRFWVILTAKIVIVFTASVHTAGWMKFFPHIRNGKTAGC